MIVIIILFQEITFIHFKINIVIIQQKSFEYPLFTMPIYFQNSHQILFVSKHSFKLNHTKSITQKQSF
jgi:hypothetical protein